MLFNEILFFAGSILEGPDPNALKPYAVMVSFCVSGLTRLHYGGCGVV